VCAALLNTNHKNKKRKTEQPSLTAQMSRTIPDGFVDRKRMNVTQEQWYKTPTSPILSPHSIVRPGALTTWCLICHVNRERAKQELHDRIDDFVIVCGLPSTVMDPATPKGSRLKRILDWFNREYSMPDRKTFKNRKKRTFEAYIESVRGMISMIKKERGWTGVVVFHDGWQCKGGAMGKQHFLGISVGFYDM
jgi:hypothetical protein